MPVCDAGSELQPNLPEVVYIDPIYAGSFLTPETEWLRPFLPFLRPFTLDMAAFCALDPPADVEFTDADLIGLIGGGGFSIAVLAGEKLAQLVHILIWYKWCRCIDFVAPDPYVPPDPPAGLPNINPPGYVAPPGAGACRTDVFTFPPQAVSVVTNSAVRTPPVGATGVRITVQGHTSDWISLVNVIYNNDNNYTVDGYIERFTQDEQTPTPPNPPGQWYRVSDSALTNVAFKTANLGPYFYVMFTTNGAAGGATGLGDATVTLEWFCDGADPDDPPAGYSPCIPCPPDPFLMGAINRISQELSYMRGQIDLIQRQAVPFAYVPGELHEDLTDAGEFSVTGLIGARVTITATFPSSIGVEAGNPEHLFGAGWIQWGNADGYSARVWLDQVDTLSFPDAAGAYTLLAYSLPPGVVVSILELEREP